MSIFEKYVGKIQVPLKSDKNNVPLKSDKNNGYFMWRPICIAFM